MKERIIDLDILNIQTKVALASDINIGNELLEDLSVDYNSDVRVAVAFNINCPVYLLKKLFKDSEREVKIAVVSNSNCPMEILEKFVNDEDYILRSLVALNPNCSEDLLLKLSNDESDFVRMKVASVVISSEILEKLSKDLDNSVRIKVAENINCSSSILKELFVNGNESIKRIVLANPNCLVEILEEVRESKEKNDYWRILNMLNHPNCSLNVLASFANHEKETVKAAVKRGLRLKLEYLSKTDFSKIFDIDSFNKDSLFDSINELNYACELYKLVSLYKKEERESAKALAEKNYSRILDNFVNTDFGKNYDIDSFRTESFVDSIDSLIEVFKEARNKGFSFNVIE